MRLRRTNADLQRLVSIYAETIRQLTLTNHDLETALHEARNLTPLAAHPHP